MAKKKRRPRAKVVHVSEDTEAIEDQEAKALEVADKKAPADIEAAAKRSVREPAPTGIGGGRTILFQLAHSADEAPQWWAPARDSWLRTFWQTAPFLPGVIYSICGRNAAFRFEFTGPEKQVQYAKDLCAQADLGAGWQSLAMKLTQDFLTQDNGAFIEVIRPARVRTSKGLLPAVKALDADGEMAWFAAWRGQLIPIDQEEYKIEDDPADLPLGIAHLDAGRCTRTGNIDHPVKYQDRKGHWHKLAWWQVITLEDMPSPIEDMNGVGFCAISRVLRAAQILRDVAVYKQEKIGGRFAGSVWATNVDADRISDAVAQAQARADSKGLTRYMPPIIAQVLDPQADPKAIEIALASLPDGFDEETALRWYITELALGTGTDYSYLAPLPGAGLGTATQVETMARQTKGKSSRLWMNTIEFKFRYHGILARDVDMNFKEIDEEEELAKDTASERRASTRSIRILSGEITPEVARQIAVDQGDLEPDYLDMMAEEEETPETTEEPSEPEGGAAPGDVTEEPEEKARHRRDKCMSCDKAPTIEVLWAEGMAHAWFCKKCYKAWLKESDMHEVNYEKEILHGIARRKFSDRTSPETLEEKGLLASIAESLKAIGDRLQLRRPGSGYEGDVNAYAEQLVNAFDEWAEKWAGRIANADERDRGPFIIEAAEEIDATMQAIATKGLAEAYLLGLEEEELTDGGYVQVQNYTDRNLQFLEYSLGPDLQTKLKTLGDEGLKDRDMVAGALGTFRGRVATYAGPYWVLIWKGTEERAKAQEQAQARQIPVTRHLDNRAEHCDTCPPKAGGYKSWDMMIADAGGVPADGSDDCGCNCRCWLTLGG